VYLSDSYGVRTQFWNRATNVKLLRSFLGQIEKNSVSVAATYRQPEAIDVKPLPDVDRPSEALPTPEGSNVYSLHEEHKFQLQRS
jgi:hypothetical protein